jgi:hypothetical protein
MKNRRSRLRLLALWIGIGCVATQGLAQSTSLLRGTLTDPQGAAIADAKIQNNVSTYTSAFPLYAYGATELIGLGEDIDTSVANYLAQKLGNPNLQLANPTAVTNASASLLGILNDVFVTYQYNRSFRKVLRSSVPSWLTAPRDILRIPIA